MNTAYICGYTVSLLLLTVSIGGHGERWSNLVAKLGATLFVMTYFYAEVVANG